jgi:mRNA interferase MazF
MVMKQFEVYVVQMNPTKGSEINKTRPAVIVSPDVMNKNLATVIIAPLTHTIKNYPTRVPSTFEGQSGEIVLDQIRAIDKSRLKKKKGKLDKITASNVKQVLQTMFS